MSEAAEFVRRHAILQKAVACRRRCTELWWAAEIARGMGCRPPEQMYVEAEQQAASAERWMLEWQASQ